LLLLVLMRLKWRMLSRVYGSVALCAVLAATAAGALSSQADAVLPAARPTKAATTTRTTVPRRRTPLLTGQRSTAGPARRRSAARRRATTTTTSVAPTTDLPATTGADRYGIASGALLFSAPDATFNADLDFIKGLGARWLRTPLKWQNAEGKGKGIYNWRAADRIVNGATSRGLSLVLTVSSTPAWALPAEAKGNPVYPPANLSDYADFVRAAVTRYHDRVHVWELGNSVSNSTGWMPGPQPSRYAQLLQLTYPAIKAADPTAVVLTGALGGAKLSATSTPGDTFLSQLYQYGAGPFFDAVSYHPYTYPYSPYDPPSKQNHRSWEHMLNARQIMVNNGDSSKQIWATEYGAPTNGRPGYSVTEARQAQLLNDAYQLFSTYPWAGPMMWFQHRDGGTDVNVADDWFGLLRPDRTEKPAAAVYRARVAAAGG